MNIINCVSAASQNGHNGIASNNIMVYCDKSVDILADSLQFCLSRCMASSLEETACYPRNNEEMSSDATLSTIPHSVPPDHLSGVHLSSERSIWNFLAAQQHILICVSLSESMYIVTNSGVVIGGITSALSAFLSCANIGSSSPCPTSIRFSLCCSPGINSPVDIVAICSLFTGSSTASVLVETFCSQFESYCKFRYSSTKVSSLRAQTSKPLHTQTKSIDDSSYQVLDLLFEVGQTLASSCQQRLLIITDGSIDYLLASPYEYCNTDSGSVGRKQALAVDFFVIEAAEQIIDSGSIFGHVTSLGRLFDVIAQRGGHGSVFDRFGEELSNWTGYYQYDNFLTKNSLLVPLKEESKSFDLLKYFGYMLYIPIDVSESFPQTKNRSYTQTRTNPDPTASNSSTWSYSRPPAAKPSRTPLLLSNPSSFHAQKKLAIGGHQNLKCASLVSIISHRIMQGFKLSSMEFSLRHMSDGLLDGVVCHFSMDKNMSGLVNIVTTVDLTLTSRNFDSTTFGSAKIRYEIAGTVDILACVSGQFKGEIDRRQQLYFSDCIYDTSANSTLIKIMAEVRNTRRADETLDELWKWLRVMDGSRTLDDRFLVLPEILVGNKPIQIFNLLKSYQFVTCRSECIFVTSKTREAGGNNKPIVDFDMICKAFVDTLNSNVSPADTKSFWVDGKQDKAVYVWSTLNVDAISSSSSSFSRCLTKVELVTFDDGSLHCYGTLDDLPIYIRISSLFIMCPPSVKKQHFEKLLSSCKSSIDCIPMWNEELLCDSRTSLVLPHFVDQNLAHIKQCARVGCSFLQPKPTRFKAFYQIHICGTSTIGPPLAHQEMEFILDRLREFQCHFHHWTIFSSHLSDSCSASVSIQLTHGFRFVTNQRPLFENLDDDEESSDDEVVSTSTPLPLSDIFNRPVSASSHHSSQSRSSAHSDERLNDVAFCCLSQIRPVTTKDTTAQDFLSYLLHFTLFASPVVGNSKDFQKLVNVSHVIANDFAVFWNIMASILSYRDWVNSISSKAGLMRSFIISAPIKQICVATFDNNSWKSELRIQLQQVIANELRAMSQLSVIVTAIEEDLEYFVVCLKDDSVHLQRDVLLLRLTDSMENGEHPIVQFESPGSRDRYVIGLEATLCCAQLVNDFYTVKKFCRMQDHGYLLDDIDDESGMSSVLMSKLTAGGALLEAVGKKAVSRYFFDLVAKNAGSDVNESIPFDVVCTILNTCFTTSQSLPNLSGILKQTIDGSVWSGLDPDKFDSYCWRLLATMTGNDGKELSGLKFLQTKSSNVFAVISHCTLDSEMPPLFLSFEIFAIDKQERNVCEKFDESLSSLRSNFSLSGAALKIIVWSPLDCEAKLTSLIELTIKEANARLRRANLIEYVSQMRIQNSNVQKAICCRDDTKIPSWIVSSVMECMTMLDERDVISLILPMTIVPPHLAEHIKDHKQSDQSNWSNYVSNAEGIIESLLANDQRFSFVQNEGLNHCIMLPNLPVGRLRVAVTKNRDSEAWCLFKLQLPMYSIIVSTPILQLESKTSKSGQTSHQQRKAREGDGLDLLWPQGKQISAKIRSDHHVDEDLPQVAMSRTTSVDVSDFNAEISDQSWITFKLHIAIERSVGKVQHDVGHLHESVKQQLIEILDVVDMARRRANQMILLQCLFSSNLASPFLIPVSFKFQAELDADPNIFTCPCVLTINFPIFHRLRVDTALSGLATSALQPLLVGNRVNTYVYRDAKGYIYYMVLRGVQTQASNRLDASSINVIELRIHGIPGVPIGDDITVHLREVIEAALHDLALQGLSSLLSANSKVAMTPSDLKFLTGESSSKIPPTYFRFDLPKFVSDEYHFLMYLLQNFNTSSYLNRINVESSELTAHDFVEEKQRDSAADSAYRDVFQDSRSDLSIYDSRVIHPAFTGCLSIVSNFLGDQNEARPSSKLLLPDQNATCINPAFFGYQYLGRDSSGCCAEIGNDLDNSGKGWFVEFKRPNFTYFYNSTPQVASSGKTPFVASSLTSKGAVLIKQAGHGIALFDFFPTCSEASDPLFPWFLATGRKKWIEDDVQELKSVISSKRIMAVTKRDNLDFKSRGSAIASPSQLCVTSPARTIVVRLFATSSLKLSVIAQVIEFCMNQSLHDYAIERLLSVKRMNTSIPISEQFENFCPNIVQCLQSSSDLVNPSTELLKIRQRLPMWCYSSLGKDLVTCVGHQHECFSKCSSCGIDDVQALQNLSVVQANESATFGLDYGTGQLSHCVYSTVIFGSCSLDFDLIQSRKVTPDFEMLYLPVYCDSETACILPQSPEYPTYSWRQWIMILQFSPTGLSMYSYNLRKNIADRVKEMCALTMNEVAARVSSFHIAQMSCLGLASCLNKSFSSITVLTATDQLSKLEADFRQRKTDALFNKTPNKYHNCHGNSSWQNVAQQEVEKVALSPSSANAKPTQSPRKVAAPNQMDAVQMAQLAARKRAQAHPVQSPSKTKQPIGDSTSLPAGLPKKSITSKSAELEIKIDDSRKDTRAEKRDGPSSIELYSNEPLSKMICLVPSCIISTDLNLEESKRYPPAFSQVALMMTHLKLAVDGPIKHSLVEAELRSQIDSCSKIAKNAALIEQLLLKLARFTQNSQLSSVASCKIYSCNWYESVLDIVSDQHEEKGQASESSKASRTANSMYEVFKRFVSRYSGSPVTDAKSLFIGLSERLPTGFLLSSNRLLSRMFGLAMFHVDVPNTSTKLIVELRGIEIDNHEVIIVEMCKVVEMKVPQSVKSTAMDHNINTQLVSTNKSVVASSQSSDLFSNHCYASTVACMWKSTNICRCVFDFIIGSVWKLIVPTGKSTESQVVRYPLDMLNLSSVMVRKSFGKFYKGKYQLVDKVVRISLPGKCVSFSSSDHGYVVDDKQLLAFICAKESAYDVKKVNMSGTVLGISRYLMLNESVKDDYAFQSFAQRSNAKPPIIFILTCANVPLSHDKCLDMRLIVIINKNQLDEENARRYPTSIRRPSDGFLTCMMRSIENDLEAVLCRASEDYVKEFGWNFFDCFIRNKHSSKSALLAQNSCPISYVSGHMETSAGFACLTINEFLGTIPELSVSTEVESISRMATKPQNQGMASWDPYSCVDWVEVLVYLNNQYVRCVLLETMSSDKSGNQLFISCCCSHEESNPCVTNSILHLVASDGRLLSCRLLRRSSDNPALRSTESHAMPDLPKKSKKKPKRIEDKDDDGSSRKSPRSKVAKKFELEPQFSMSAEEYSTINRVTSLILSYCVNKL